MIHSKMKRLMAYTSKSRFIRYLRGMGMVIGEYTEFVSPIHSEVDLGRAIRFVPERRRRSLNPWMLIIRNGKKRMLLMQRKMPNIFGAIRENFPSWTK